MNRESWFCEPRRAGPAKGGQCVGAVIDVSTEVREMAHLDAANSRRLLEQPIPTKSRGKIGTSEVRPHANVTRQRSSTSASGFLSRRVRRPGFSGAARNQA